jgi:hypothetical protein
MQTDNAFEMWQARASLQYTDPLGKEDVPPPPNVRHYLEAGTQHTTVIQPTRGGSCQQLSNPNRYQEALRALVLAMQRWIADGKEPPASRYPRIADGTLVPSAQIGFPRIPGVRYIGALNHKAVNDFSVQPPRHVENTDYTVLVPKVDADGNDIPGVRSLAIQVPVATYTGWNMRTSGAMDDLLCGNGSYIPFAKTAAERGNDPRASVQERYANRQAYVDKVKAAGVDLMREGFLLQEDYERMVEEARHADIGLPR